MKLLKVSYIPNYLSVFRILLVPFFVYLFQVTEQRIVAVGVFLLAGITDVIDGYLARHFKWITNIGKILDPFADKCMQLAAILCLGQCGFLPWWVVIILAGKEFFLLVGGLFALKKEKVYVQSNWYGKAGTVAFYIIATVLALFENMNDTLRVMLGILLILFMLFALVMYIVNYIKNIMNTNNTK